MRVLLNFIGVYIFGRLAINSYWIINESISRVPCQLGVPRTHYTRYRVSLKRSDNPANGIGFLANDSY